MRAPLLAAALALTSLSCGDSDATGPGTDGSGVTPSLEISVEGRIERGLAVTARVLADGEVVPDSLIEWSAEPVNAIQTESNGRVRFLRTGVVTLTAEGLDTRAERSLDVAVPPTLVFEGLRDGNRDIYRVQLDGLGLVRLTTDPGEDRNPTAAAGAVVFVSGRDGSPDLYSVPLAAGAVTRLTETAATEADPALSPDGGRLAFTREDDGVFKVWWSASDGTGATRAAPDFGFSGSIEAGPSWSPAGDRIAFVSTDAGTADIYAARLEDGAVDRLGGGGAAEVEPAWDPDGGRVAFASNRTGDTELFLLDLESGETAQLTDRPGTDAQPAWLPDGRLLYTAWVDGTPGLRWLDPANPDTSFPIPAGGSAARHPAGAFE